MCQCLCGRVSGIDVFAYLAPVLPMSSLFFIENASSTKKRKKESTEKVMCDFAISSDEITMAWQISRYFPLIFKVFMYV